MNVSVLQGRLLSYVTVGGRLESSYPWLDCHELLAFAGLFKLEDLTVLERGRESFIGE